MEGNGKGIFLSVVGVATLMVAIVGATFAFFTASETVNDVVQGSAATAGLNLAVTKVSQNGTTAGLIPLDEANIQKALSGDTATGSKMCVDKNNNTVCHVYKIAVENTGTSAALLDGSIDITAAGYANLKWNLMTNATTSTLANSKVLTNKVITTADSFQATDGTADAGNDYKEYYVMIYINNLDSSQVATDTGTFTGVVTFNSASGSEVKAQFTA